MKRFQGWLVGALAVVSLSAGAETALLNASYDVMRDFYKDLNPAFVKAYTAKTGETVSVNQSHGPSSKQAQSVIQGLEADVVTMNTAIDIVALAKAGVVSPAWASKFPQGAVPFTSLQVLLVRKGNPKQIKDWSDLLKPGVQVVIPNPKTAGNGRYTYLAAWGYALKQPGGSEAKAKEFVTRLFKQAPTLPAGGRGATTTFIQNQIGDVLITFENEAEMIAREFGKGQFDVVYPTVSIQADPPVAVVDKVVDKKGSRKVAEAYLQFLWSPEGQEIAAQNYLRPRSPEVLKRHADKFPAIKTFSVDEVFGSWPQAQEVHFKDGGLFDQIFTLK